MQIEYEAKGLIEKEQYEHLKNSLNISKKREQTNYYFETEDNFFRNHNTALRVRVIDDEYILMYKVRTDNGNEEYDVIIDQQTFAQLQQTRAIDLRQYALPLNIQLSNLNIIKMHTTRLVANHNGATIELDKTDFGVKTDYEIEIEATSMDIANAHMSALNDEFNLCIKKSYPKIARFYMYND